MVQAGSIGWWNVLLFLIIALIVIGAVVSMNEGQRRIPVQYAPARAELWASADPCVSIH
jgi:preprotein translocase subunit SecY